MKANEITVTWHGAIVAVSRQAKSSPTGACIKLASKALAFHSLTTLCKIFLKHEGEAKKQNYKIHLIYSKITSASDPSGDDKPQDFRVTLQWMLLGYSLVVTWSCSNLPQTISVS